MVGVSISEYYVPHLRGNMEKTRTMQVGKQFNESLESTVFDIRRGQVGLLQGTPCPYGVF